MPIYLYKCPKCAGKQEISHPMLDTPQIICPNCSIPTEKLPGVGAVSFKGGGWGKDAR
jgi:putative FmdB family regulatory protein